MHDCGKRRKTNIDNHISNTVMMPVSKKQLNTFLIAGIKFIETTYSVNYNILSALYIIPKLLLKEKTNFHLTINLITLNFRGP